MGQLALDMHYVENQVSLEENMTDLFSGFEQNQEGDRMGSYLGTA